VVTAAVLFGVVTMEFVAPIADVGHERFAMTQMVGIVMELVANLVSVESKIVGCMDVIAVERTPAHRGFLKDVVNLGPSKEPNEKIPCAHGMCCTGERLQVLRFLAQSGDQSCRGRVKSNRAMRMKRNLLYLVKAYAIMYA
jgi:hypothetical protein